MTSNTDKFRALFLATLMVVSVFGGVAAFAGSAAADDATLSGVDDKVQSGNDITFDADTTDGDNVTVWIDENEDGYVNSSEANETFQGAAVTDETLTVPSDLSEGTYVLAAVDNETFTGTADDTVEFEVDNSGPSIRKATHYNNTTDDVIELAFDEAVDASGAMAWAVYADGTEESITLDRSDEGQNQLVAVQDYSNDLEEVKINGVEDTAGNSVEGTSDNATVDVTVAPETIEAGVDAEAEVYAGTNIALHNDTIGESFTIEGEGIDRVRGAGDGSNVYVLDTDDLDAGTYNITHDGQTTELTLQELGLTAESDADSFSTAEDVTATVTAQDIDREVEAVLLDDEGEESDYSATGTISSDGDVVLNFGQVAVADVGNYTVEVTDIESGVTSESDSFAVEEAGAGDLGFAEATTETAQGDVASVTVEFDDPATTGTLLIGNEAEDGYQANISVEDGDADGEVTVYFNTYTAGDVTEDTVWAAGDDDSATLDNYDQGEQELNDILDTGSYELAVSSSDSATDTLDEPDGVGTLYVEERSTDAVNLWTTAAGPTDFETVSDISDAVDDETLTESNTFAKEDSVVVQLTASGLEGMIHDDTAIEDGVATDGFTNNLGVDAKSGFNLTATQLNPGSNTDANELDFSEYDGDMTVFYDEASDNYYVVIDTADFEGNWDATGDGDVEDGDEFELNFELQDKNLLDYEDGLEGEDLEAEYDTLSTEFTVEDRTASFDTEEVDDTDYVTVNAESGQVISGSTNVAPGSEIRIRAQGAGDARFVKEQTELTVQPDGTFSAEFDFSDRAVDEEFEVTLRGDVSTTASGIVVEAEEDVTTTEPTTTEPTTTEPTTTEPTTTEPTTTEETTTEPTTTPTQTPGFGIAVAMLALIGAALIALRRRN